MSQTSPQLVHRLFSAGILAKGIDGVLEIVGAILAAVVDPQALNSLVISLTAHELSRDPQDWFAITLRRMVQGLSPSTTLFASFYLASHGLVKILLVIGLMRNKRWAYPTTIWVFALFVVYQVYRYTHTHSVGLLVMTVIDIVVIWLVWAEYRSQKQTGFSQRLKKQAVFFP